MKKLLVVGLVGVAVTVSLGAAAATAQTPVPGVGGAAGGGWGGGFGGIPGGAAGRRGPALTPYLNLRRGGNPAANYFLGVLPEIDRRTTATQQNAAITDLERRVDTPLASEEPLLEGRSVRLPPTGHATYFGSTGNYFGPSGPLASPSPGIGRPRGR
jgi:hypothetical protein